MGYMRHHAIVVTSVFGDKIKAAHEKALEIFKHFPDRRVSPILGAVINGYQSFFVAPDGSKEFWTDSDDHDEYRKEFRRWLRSQCYEDGSSPIEWVEVQYGDAERETMVIDDSDADRRNGNVAPVF